MSKPVVEGGTPLIHDYLPFCPPTIEKEEIDAITSVLTSGWITTGAKAQEFEKSFCQYTGAQNALALNSCTAALHLSLIAHGIGPGDDVLVPAMTFAATANVVELVGAKPVLVDALEDFNIDTSKIEEKITNKTKAIIPVHFGGLPCDMDVIDQISNEHNLKIIEDCAHAIGSAYRGKRMGSRKNLACFSFYPTKNMTTIEGGMITGDGDSLFAKLKMLSLHGLSKDAFKRFSKEGVAHYEIEFPGYKYNMTDVSAAIGLCQLGKIDRFNSIRANYAKYLFDRLEEAPGITLPLQPPPHVTHSWHLFPLLINQKETRITRDEMLDALKRENIGTGVHYRSLHVHKYYREKYGFKEFDYPVAASIGNNVFSVPFSHSMNMLDLEKVADIIVRIAKYYKK